MIGSEVKPEGAIVKGDNGVWYKYGIGRYGMYYHNGWRECSQVTNENIGRMVEGKTKEEPAALYMTAKAFTVPQEPIAIKVLAECVRIQSDRGTEYDKAGQQERSFTRVADAFNAITGKNITPAEVCLIQQVLKDVRQWSNPNRLHKDSVIDGVNYGALKSEELFKQFGAML